MGSYVKDTVNGLSKKHVTDTSSLPSSANVSQLTRMFENGRYSDVLHNSRRFERNSIVRRSRGLLKLIVYGRDYQNKFNC